MANPNALPQLLQRAVTSTSSYFTELLLHRTHSTHRLALAARSVVLVDDVLLRSLVDAAADERQQLRGLALVAGFDGGHELLDLGLHAAHAGLVHHALLLRRADALSCLLAVGHLLGSRTLSLSLGRLERLAGGRSVFECFHFFGDIAETDVLLKDLGEVAQGITGLALLLAKMPWNRGSGSCGASCQIGPQGT